MKLIKNTFKAPESLLGYQNAKTTKGEDLGYLTGILYLAPSDLSGVDLCPKASEGCKKACLFTAGRGKFRNVVDARMNKTIYFLKDRKAFVSQLHVEIARANKKAQRLGLKLCIRLNGTSDIAWEALTDIIQSFPDIQFYDYTKISKRFERVLPSNYHLTFSLSESNDAEALKVLALGGNVAAVFKNGMPSKFLGAEVIDGDLHDLRFLDKKPQGQRGVIVALKAKGEAKKDASGFVRDACEGVALKKAA
jgi:hypothetical protein